MVAADDSHKGEQEHQRLAFETFYALGSKRTYRQAAQKLGVSPSSVKLWCRTFGWRPRIAARDTDAARQMADRAADHPPTDRDRDLKIVRMAKMVLTKDIAERKVRGRVPDLESLIRFEAELMANQDERYAWIDRETDPGKLRARLRELAAEADVRIEGASTESPAGDHQGTEVTPDEPPPGDTSHD